METDERGWPIRYSKIKPEDKVRICALPGCGEDEFRIDGYCSREHRDRADIIVEARIAGLREAAEIAEKRSFSSRARTCEWGEACLDVFKAIRARADKLERGE